MQTITRENRRLTELREQINFHHAQFCNAAEQVLSARQVGLYHRWQCGMKLNEAKSLIGHGNFTVWIESNCRFDERTAQRYMKIDNDNAHLRSKATELSATSPDPKQLTRVIAQLTDETLRKDAYAYVPAKPQAEHKGNIKFQRLSNYVNVANDHAKILQRHIDGLQLIDFDQAREDLCTGPRSLYAFCKWLSGDSDTRPW